ncbi:hypothetical protein HH310_37560 [Actinoplanes sp. TBRC 11911]|uniref:DUF6461 domain-containing protein n=1 Tax=Actinoplanes sp. TBRC 11911 TaxID=2729386 RepID=UPI00145F225E|nr:DUF6461 domain-containing protein [Actinoplanes sp. TBRC 11911]NMO56868.1 hypothetical protein [Actinoplanes sp. TBRC 11911]
MVAEDYAWAIESYALSLDFCLTFVRGLEPDEVIARLGGADPVPIVSAEAALGAAQAVQEWVDESGGTHSSELDFVAVTRAGDWAMIIEPNGFLCTDDAVVRSLSTGGEMVSFYYNENTTPQFAWSVGGVTVVAFDPGSPAYRHGIDRSRLDPLLVEVGFGLDNEGQDFDQEFQQRALALMERITGVGWDAAFLQTATFHCAGVAGAGRRVEPWYAEVREELAAYAEDPDEWVDDDFDRWGERGVTDRRVKALGSAGTRLYEEDRELALAIAYAPEELIERMSEWAWERPFRAAGVLDEPWLAPIRERVRRGEVVPPEDVRLVEERLDPYLRTVLPPWLRDDEGQRSNTARGLVVQWDSYGPAADLCWAFARAEGAGGGSWPEMFAALRRDFPELDEIVAPPPPPPPPERDAVRRKREAQEHQEEQGRLADLKRTWGGRIPSNPRLLEPEVSARALGLVPYDRDLIDLVADAEPADQRRMAVWAARYCCTRSGLIARDWAEAGLDALENGDPPPPWFADHDAAFARLFDVPRESITHTGRFSIGDAEPTPRIDPEILAIHTVVMARDADPLIAAMDTVHNAVALDPDSAPVAFRAAFGRP